MADVAEFRTSAAFRAWLKRHHARAGELVVRLYKRHASHRGIGYAEALDEALCWGWIDGVRRSVDADSFSVRFTPRRPRSIWSRVNVGHVERLLRQGRMQKPGIDAFTAREDTRLGVYSFEQGATELARDQVRAFRAHPEAWAWYRAMPPGYRRTCAHWVRSAKKEETRQRRLATLIACSAEGRTVPPLTRKAPGGMNA